MAKGKRAKQNNKRPKKSPMAVTEFLSVPAEAAESDAHTNYVTFEEAQKDESKFKIWRQQIIDWLKEESAKLEAILLQYNSFDLIGNLTITQLFVNPEKHNVASHSGLPAIVEYATLLYLKHPYGERLPLPIGKVPLEEIDQISRTIQLGTALYYGSDEMRTIQGKQREAIDSLRFRTMTHEMAVRSPGYEHHQRDTLVGLFQESTDWMLASLGFSVLDVLAVEDAIQSVTSRKVFRRFDEGKEAIDKLKKDVRLARRGKLPKSDSTEMITHLSGLPPSKASTQIKIAISGWIFSFIGTACKVFDAGELADEAKLPIERVLALLAFFSLEFGSMPSDFFLMSPTHPLRERPFIHNAGSFLYPVPGSMIWALQKRVETEMNPATGHDVGNSKAWKKYEKHRANYLESESLKLFKTMLKTDEVYSNLSYSFVGDGEQKEGELDGLIAFDKTLLLVEAKAGALTASARRGGRERIKSNIKSLLGKAHQQALRAHAYIEKTDFPKFLTEDGSEISVDKSRFERVFLVSTTLDPMDVFNAALHEVVSAGLIEEKHLPWVVSIDNLRVIAEMNEFPTQFIHYLTRRLRVNDFKKFYAGDELDWFGLYLSKGLYFDKDERFAEATHVMFDGSFSADFDDYYFYAQGQRVKPAVKPRQPMPKLLRRIILELDSHTEADGHSEAILRLLDWDDESREKFIAGLGELRRRTRNDGRIHDFTMASSDEGAGVTCFATSPSNSREAQRKLRSYCFMKKYQVRADSWVGFLTLVDQNPIIQGFVVLADPWAHDDELERFVARLPTSQ
jgi:hypothetical protein